MRKWLRRFGQEGLAGLQDRPWRLHRLRQPTPQATIDQIEALRRQRLPGEAIAAQTGVSSATVSRILKKHGHNRLGALEPAEPPRRYQSEKPSELVHIDIKKLGSFNSLCRKLIDTRPYIPRTNDKTERRIQAALREWAYARAYETSRQRADQLPLGRHRYNWHRPHGSIGAKLLIGILGMTRNNLLRLHT